MPEIPETKEEEDLLNKLKPLNAADGYTEHRVSDALSARHPFLPEQGAKVAPSDVTLAYGHAAPARFAMQLAQETDPATLNSVLATVVSECANPEFVTQFARQQHDVDYANLLKRPELQLRVAACIGEVASLYLQLATRSCVSGVLRSEA